MYLHVFKFYCFSIQRVPISSKLVLIHVFFSKNSSYNSLLIQSTVYKRLTIKRWKYNTHFSSRSLLNFCRANSMRQSTSSFERLKFSMLKAYTVTSIIPRFKHHSSVCKQNRISYWLLLDHRLYPH